MYVSKLPNVFVQINRLKQLCPLRCRALYWRHRCLSCILAASSNWNIRFFPQTRFLQKQKLISPPILSPIFPNILSSCKWVLHRRRAIGNTPLDIWQILAIELLFSSRTKPKISFFLQANGKWVAENYVFERWQNLCDKVILLGHLLLRFLSWRKFFSSDTFFFLFIRPPSTFYLHISDEFVKEQHWDSKLN